MTCLLTVKTFFPDAGEITCRTEWCTAKGSTLFLVYGRMTNMVWEIKLFCWLYSLKQLMEAEKEKNNDLINAHLRGQQNGATTSSPSPTPATVPDSMSTLNIGYHASTVFIFCA